MFIVLSDVRSPPFFSPLSARESRTIDQLIDDPWPLRSKPIQFTQRKPNRFQFNALISAAIPHRFFNARSILYLPSPSKVEATERF